LKKLKKQMTKSNQMKNDIVAKATSDTIGLENSGRQFFWSKGIKSVFG
jgi:hypothetical protein